MRENEKQRWVRVGGQKICLFIIVNNYFNETNTVGQKRTD